MHTPDRSLPESLLTDEQVRTQVLAALMERLSASVSETASTRQEALRDVLGLSVPGLDDRELHDLVRLVPAIPSELYVKWAGLFADRLLETIPRDVLSELCQDTQDSRAALTLTFVMFMESARMEKVAADDLRALGLSLSENDTTTQVGVWLREHITAGRQ